MEHWQKAQEACNALVLVTLRINSLIKEVNNTDKDEELIKYSAATHGITDSIEVMLEAMELTLTHVREGLYKDVQELKNAD